jgi:CRP-like cAMP-binding protein
MADRRTSALSKVPLFEGLSQRQLKRLTQGTIDYEFPLGKKLVEQGQRGETLFVLLEGTARVVRGGRTVARIGPGEFFGEVAVLDQRPRSATVVADTPVRCLVLHRDDVKKMISDEPATALAMLANLASRLRGD